MPVQQWWVGSPQLLIRSDNAATAVSKSQIYDVTGENIHVLYVCRARYGVLVTAFLFASVCQNQSSIYYLKDTAFFLSPQPPLAGSASSNIFSRNVGGLPPVGDNFAI